MNVSMERTATSRPLLAAGAAALIVTLLALVPRGLALGDVYLAASIAINVLLALGLVALMGYGGYFSLGQGVLFGAGAYTVAVLASRTTTELLPLLGIAVLVGAVAGGLMGLSCLRTEHLYLAMVTLAYAFILGDVALNWIDVTGGGQGLVVATTIFGEPVLGADLYYLALGASCLTLLVILTTRGNRIGRAQALTRMSPVAAQSLGVRTNALMVGTFVGSGAVSGFAGGLYAVYIGLVDPDVFDFNRTVATLTIVVIAGMRSPLAVVVIAPVLLYLQSSTGNEVLSNWLPFAYAALVIVALRVAPRGVGGALGGLSLRRPREVSHV